ncbi:MAG: phytoene/squalene synthase family protein [Candidatus Nanopelagicales bacterium]
MSLADAYRVMSLADAYRVCRDVHQEHGRSYFLATRLLPGWKRRHVHALYAFTRCTDDIVDSLEPDRSYDPDVQERCRRLQEWGERFRSGLPGGASPEDPVLQAVRHTIAVFDLDHADFESFLTSMTMDLTVTEYADYDALLTYMEGSAAVIGTMMLPILLADELPAAMIPQTLADAREPARQLGLAFQLTNFIRDVREDAVRGRIYLPGADLEQFGVHRADLVREIAGAGVRDLVAFEVSRARQHYLAARVGLASLPPRSRRCIRLATSVYGAILTEVEAAGYDVLAGRVRVPYRRRAAMTASELLRR